ncbi:ATP-binding protein [Desulfuribacillus stibiiarsenatis]|nr:ATP-binding protein [Desulfuribacillus stibiiarsenatis]
MFTIVFLGVFVGKYFDELYYSFETRSLVSKANHISEVIVFRQDKKLASEITWEIAREAKASVFIETQWEFIGSVDTGVNLEEIPEEVKLSPTDIERIYQGQVVVRRGFLQDQQSEILAVGVPLVNQRREIFGAVTLYKPTQQISEIINQAEMLIVYTATIALLLSIVLAIYLSKRISDPLLQMNDVARNMAEGKFNRQIHVKTDDEIGTLGHSMNVLALELDSSIQALNKEKEQLNSILSSMSDSVMTISKDKKIIISNPPATKLLKQWVMNYRTGQQYYIDRLPKELADMIVEAFNKEEELNHDVNILGRTYAVAVDPLYQNSKQINGIVAVLRDVTEEKRMDKLRKDFVANVSHELRTPLAMLQGYSEALLDDIAEDPKTRKELAEVINDEALRMKRLVNDLLDLAKLEARQIELDKTTIEMREVLDSLLKKYTRLHPNKEFAFQTSGHDIYCYVDIARIEQVLINLIDNAVRHTGDHGKITVELFQNDMVTITVQDNGFGIPEEDLPFIFERFYKADKARTRSKSGTGLGLAITKNIIEAHLGEISVKSQIDVGTTFIIELPKLSGEQW